MRTNGRPISGREAEPGEEWTPAVRRGRVRELGEGLFQGAGRSRSATPLNRPRPFPTSSDLPLPPVPCLFLASSRSAGAPTPLSPPVSVSFSPCPCPSILSMRGSPPDPTPPCPRCPSHPCPWPTPCSCLYAHVLQVSMFPIGTCPSVLPETPWTPVSESPCPSCLCSHICSCRLGPRPHVPQKGRRSRGGGSRFFILPQAGCGHKHTGNPLIASVLCKIMSASRKQKPNGRGTEDG